MQSSWIANNVLDKTFSFPSVSKFGKLWKCSAFIWTIFRCYKHEIYDRIFFMMVILIFKIFKILFKNVLISWRGWIVGTRILPKYLICSLKLKNKHLGLSAYDWHVKAVDKINKINLKLFYISSKCGFLSWIFEGKKKISLLFHHWTKFILSLDGCGET